MTIAEDLSKNILIEETKMFFKNIKDRGRVPTVKNSNYLGLANKAIFYTDLRIDFRIREDVAGYELVINLIVEKKGSYQTIGWRCLFSILRTPQDLDNAIHNLQAGLHNNFGSMPATKASKVLFGV